MGNRHCCLTKPNPRYNPLMRRIPWPSLLLAVAAGAAACMAVLQIWPNGWPRASYQLAWGGRFDGSASFSPDGKFLFSANGPSNDISVVDLASEKEIQRIPAGESPWGVTIVLRD